MAVTPVHSKTARWGDGVDFSSTPKDTLLPLTKGSSLAVQFSRFGDLPAVIHIARKVPIADDDFL